MKPRGKHNNLRKQESQKAEAQARKEGLVYLDAGFLRWLSENGYTRNAVLQPHLKKVWRELEVFRSPVFRKVTLIDPRAQNALQLAYSTNREEVEKLELMINVLDAWKDQDRFVSLVALIDLECDSVIKPWPYWWR
jgi:hypothetical protein